MMNKNEIYVLNQPKKLINALVVVTGNFPLDEKIHEGLFKLKEVADITFIFNSFHFKEIWNIDKRKFSNLYGATSFIISEYNLGESIFKVLDYSTNIFQKHTGFIITDTNTEITDEDCKKLLEVTGSSIAKPILKIRKLNSEEFFNIYKKEDITDEIVKSKSNSFILKIINLIFNNFNISKINEEDLVNDYDSYCTHTSESSIVYLRSNTVNLLLFEYRSENIKNIVNSFLLKSDFRYMLSSLIKYLEINNLDIDFKNLEINKLYEKQQ